MSATTETNVSGRRLTQPGSDSIEFQIAERQRWGDHAIGAGRNPSRECFSQDEVSHRNVRTLGFPGRQTGSALLASRPRVARTPARSCPANEFYACSFSPISHPGDFVFLFRAAILAPWPSRGFGAPGLVFRIGAALASGTDDRSANILSEMSGRQNALLVCLQADKTTLWPRGRMALCDALRR